MKKKLDKASVHNGRANSKGVAYHANHNTLELSRAHQPHIDPDRIYLNSYIQYLDGGAAIAHKGGEGGYDSRKHEVDRYRQLYGEGLDARNERYIASGHRERVKSVRQVYRDPKTAPMETIFQLGKHGSETDQLTRTQVMTGAWGDVLQHLHQRYGENLIPLTASLHRDEACDHIHFRYALGAVDKFGHFMPNQNQALAAMGFDGRNPETGKKDRYHNPLVAFTDEVRETFYQACERRGVQIDREVTSGSRRQLELLDQKRDGLERELAATQEATQRAKQSLDAMETKQLLAEMEAEEAALAAERAIQSKNEAQAAEAAIKAQARYEAEATVRELEAQLWEKDSIIHALQTETEKLKHKLSTLREFLQEKNMFENFLSWFRGRNQQQSLDDRER